MYAVEWEQAAIVFYVDDTVLPKHPTGRSTVRSEVGFGDPIFLILNVALGGDLPDPPPDRTTGLPQTMIVDYVRVYIGDSRPVLAE